MLMNGCIIKDNKNKAKYIAASAIDLGEIKKSENKIKETQHFLQSIFRAAPVGIGVVKERVLIKENANFCSLVGYSEKEVIGKPASVFLPNSRRKRLRW